eukprot:c42639_g1_i1 orf=1-207(-)
MISSNCKCQQSLSSFQFFLSPYIVFHLYSKHGFQPLTLEFLSPPCGRALHQISHKLTTTTEPRLSLSLS